METQPLTSKEQMFVSTDVMLRHWQGHRNLTRRVIEAFPEDKLFSHSIGGMRPFAHMVMEMIDIAEPGVKSLATGNWEKVEEFDHTKTMPQTKEGLLERWDKVTALIDKTWPTIAPERFQKVEIAFGQYENANYDTLFYFMFT